MESADYSILRAFSCFSFFHQSEGKLEPIVKKYVFLGYIKKVKLYRLWDRSQKGRSIIISRDVTFNKSEIPWKKGEEHQEFDRKESPFDVKWLRVHIPNTFNEIESHKQNLQNSELEGDGEVVEDDPTDQNPLAD